MTFGSVGFFVRSVAASGCASVISPRPQDYRSKPYR